MPSGPPTARAIFYTLQDDNHRPLKTYRHVLGEPQAADRLVYEEKDTGMFTGVGKTNSERFIVIDIHDHDTSENWIIDAAQAGSKHRGSSRRGYAESNTTSSIGTISSSSRPMRRWREDYKIVTAPVADPRPANWTRSHPAPAGLLHHRHYRPEELARPLERENALPRIVVRDMNTGEEHAIAFDEEAYSLGFGDMREYDTDILRFTYSSMTTPTPGLRLRHAQPHAACCARRRKCRAGMIRRIM